MNFSPEFIETLKKKISIVDVTSRHVALQRKGSRLIGLCPFHKEKTPSFFIFEQDDSYYCYGCKAHGDIFSFVMNTRGVDFPVAVESLAQEAGIPLPEAQGYVDSRVNQEKKKYHELLDIACSFYEQQLHANVGHKARHYLKGRSITDDMIKRFRLGYAPAGHTLRDYLLDKGYSIEQLHSLQLVTRTGEVDFFRQRLLFPITDKYGKVIAFGGRSLDGSEPKYLNSGDTPIFQKGHNLYGYAQSRECHEKDKPLIICEGYLDVIALQQAGFAKAVAPLGTALGDAQIELAWRLHPNPIVCFDGDTAGARASLSALERALPVLRPGHSLQFVMLPQGEDPDSLVRQGKQEILSKIFAHPQALATKLWDSFLEQMPLETPEQQAFFKQKMLKKLDLIKNFDIKKSYQELLTGQFYQMIRSLNRGYPTNMGSKIKKIGQHQSISAVRIRHKILLALPLYHPQILEEIYELLLGFDFQDHQFNVLKEAIISYINEQRPLDIKEFHTHLKNEGHKDLLKELLAKNLQIHEKCLDFHAIIKDVLEQWYFYYNQFVEQAVKEEERLRRYQQIRQELRSFDVKNQ